MPTTLSSLNNYINQNTPNLIYQPGTTPAQPVSGSSISGKSVTFKLGGKTTPPAASTTPPKTTTPPAAPPAPTTTQVPAPTATPAPTTVQTTPVPAATPTTTQIPLPTAPPSTTINLSTPPSAPPATSQPIVTPPTAPPATTPTITPPSIKAIVQDLEKEPVPEKSSTDIIKASTASLNEDLVSLLAAKNPELIPQGNTLVNPVTKAAIDETSSTMVDENGKLLWRPGYDPIADIGLSANDLATYASLMARTPQLVARDNLVSSMLKLVDANVADLRAGNLTAATAQIQQSIDDQPITFMSKAMMMSMAQAAGAGAGLSVLATAVPGQDLPQDENDWAAFYSVTLSKYNPEGDDNGDNKLIIEYFPDLIPALCTSQKDVGKLANLARTYETMYNGEEGASETILPAYDASKNKSGAVGYWVNKITEGAAQSFLGDPRYKMAFKTNDLQMQKDKIANFSKLAIDAGIEPGFAMRLVQGLIASVGNDQSRNDLNVWTRNGGLDDYIKTDTLWLDQHDLTSYFSSPQGQMTFGATMSAISVAGAFVAAGPAGAAVAAGMMPFSISEEANYFGMADYRTKANLQAKGLWPADQAQELDEQKNTVDQVVKMVGYTGDKTDPAQNLKNLEMAHQALDKYKKALSNIAVPLKSINNWDSEKANYDNMVALLDSASKLYDSKGNVISGKAVQLPISVRAPNDVQWHIGGQGNTIDISGAGSGKFETVGSTNQPFDGYIHYTDPETGEDKVGPGVKVYPGSNISPIDLVDFIQNQEQYKKKPKGSEDFNMVRTITGEPGTKVTIDNQTLTIGGKVTGIDVFGKQGGEQPVKITYPDGKSEVKKITFMGSPWAEIGTNVKTLFEPYKASGYGLVVLNFQPGQKVTIDNEIIDPKHYGLARIMPIGQHQLMVGEEGHQLVETTFNVKDDITQWVAAKGYPEREGGGGGGGSAGDAQSKQIDLKPVGHIIYGETLRGCRIWADTVEISPEIGKSYDYDPGYHAIKATKYGFKDYEDTVYVTADKTLTLSPVMTAIPSTTGTPGTPPTEEPPGTATYGKIRFMGDCEGAIITLDGKAVKPVIGTLYDIETGYHSVVVKKEGYDDWTKSLYISKNESLDVSPTLTKAITPPATPAPTSKGKVKFGNTCTGARVFLDDVEIYPVIDTLYEIDAGYHAIVLKKSGYSDWSKSVYVSKDDTLTVSPVFESVITPPGTSPTDTSSSDVKKRIYFNSNPSGSKIVIDDKWTGQYTPGYVDLVKGFYTVKLNKTGYKVKATYLYITDTIRWGDDAITYATNDGVI